MNLDEVKKKNPEVAFRGFYTPPDCQPRDRVRATVLSVFFLSVTVCLGCYCYSISRQRGTLEGFSTLHDTSISSSTYPVQDLCYRAGRSITCTCVKELLQTLNKLIRPATVTSIEACFSISVY